MHELHLSRRERQITDIIFASGRATVLEIQAALPDPPSATAIRTMLRILEDKGVLKRRKQGREFVYMPTEPRRRAGMKALRHVIETFFDGSLENALAAQLTQSKKSLTQEEFRRIAHLIEQARSQGKRNARAD